MASYLGDSSTGHGHGHGHGQGNSSSRESEACGAGGGVALVPPPPQEGGLERQPSLVRRKRVPSVGMMDEMNGRDGGGGGEKIEYLGWRAS